MRNNAKQLIAVSDFLVWASGFEKYAIEDHIQRVRGIRITPLRSDIFGFLEDDLGLMLIMPESEGFWLESLPVSHAILYRNESELCLVTQEFEMTGQKLAPFSINFIILNPAAISVLSGRNLLGFGLVSPFRQPKRVNRIVGLTSV